MSIGHVANGLRSKTADFQSLFVCDSRIPSTVARVRILDMDSWNRRGIHFLAILRTAIFIRICEQPGCSPNHAGSPVHLCDLKHDRSTSASRVPRLGYGLGGLYLPYDGVSDHDNTDSGWSSLWKPFSETIRPEAIHDTLRACANCFRRRRIR